MIADVGVGVGVGVGVCGVVGGGVGADFDGGVGATLFPSKVHSVSARFLRWWLAP